MKKLILLVALLGGACLECEAQSWLDMLKGLFSSEETTEEVAAPEESYITARKLLANWSYKRAVVEYTGNDAIASMAVSALKDQVEGYCTKAGIVAGRDYIAFQKGNLVRIQIADKKLTGTYRYDPETGGITISVPLNGKSVSLRGETHYKEGRLTLLFPADKALQTLKSAMPNLAQNDYVKIAESVVSNYPGILIGAEF